MSKNVYKTLIRCLILIGKERNWEENPIVSVSEIIEIVVKIIKLTNP